MEDDRKKFLEKLGKNSRIVLNIMEKTTTNKEQATKQQKGEKNIDEK